MEAFPSIPALIVDVDDDDVDEEEEEEGETFGWQPHMQLKMFSKWPDESFTQEEQESQQSQEEIAHLE